VADASTYVDCSDARYAIGINIPDAVDRVSGDVRSIDAISLRSSKQTIGYRYTMNDGRTFVADRSRDRTTLGGLSAMNDLVNLLSQFRYNAFDPRDQGYTVFGVRWDPAAVRKLGLNLTPCPRRR
jgi:hypothetical protein